MRYLDDELSESEVNLERLEDEMSRVVCHEPGYENLVRACRELDLKRFEIVKVDSRTYYETDLETRRRILGATSTEQLCKTIIMENKRFLKDHVKNPRSSRFYSIVIQYITRLDNKRLREVVGELEGAPPNNYNFRLVKEADLKSLTSSTHNGICPIGNKRSIPTIVDSKVMDVAGGSIWVGGGTVDLKLQLDAKEFVEKTGAHIASIT